MSEQSDAKIKYGFWGFLAGAGFAMFVGFNWGGWSTSSATEKMRQEAVLANRAAICVAQFMGAADRKTNIKEYQGLEAYQRSELIEKGGWDRMPGEEKAAWGVSTACVAGLDAAMKPDMKPEA